MAAAAAAGEEVDGADGGEGEGEGEGGGEGGTVANGVRARLCGLLIDSGAEVLAQSSAGWTLCYLAAQEGDAIDVLWLLGEGVPPDHPSLDGATALQIACQHGHADAAAALLSHGALPPRRPAAATTAATHHSTWWRRRSAAATSPWRLRTLLDALVNVAALLLERGAAPK